MRVDYIFDLKKFFKRDKKHYSFLINIIENIRDYNKEYTDRLACLTWQNLRQENKGEKNIKKLFYKDTINMIDICKQLEKKEMIMHNKLDELLLKIEKMGETLELDW